MRTIELYSASKHKQQLSDWYQAWNLPDNSDNVSNLGLITQDIGAIFLFTTNSPLCLLDGFISNPASDKEERDYYLDRMVSILMDQGKQLGFKVIMGTTRLPAVLDRATKLGFKEMNNYHFFVRSL